MRLSFNCAVRTLTVTATLFACLGIAVLDSRAQNQDTPAAEEAPRTGLLDDTAADEGTTALGELTQREREQRDVRAQQLRQEVTRKIELVLAIVNEDPDAAILQLKRLLNTVLASSDIDATVREGLRTRIQQRLEQIN